jgi:hypothetical protein
VRDRILVHIDAHHDMWWIPDDAPVTIANFICPAIKNDLVREVIWVVPDATWTSKESREAVLRHVEEIEKKYPGARYRATVGPTEMSTQVRPESLHESDQRPSTRRWPEEHGLPVAPARIE